MTKFTLQIPGSLEIDSAAPALGGGKFKDIVHAKSAQRYRIEGTRAADKGSTVDANGEDIVELELEGGVRLWTTVAQMQSDFPGAFKRGASSGAYTVPLALPIGVPAGADASSRGARGIGDWALKALRIVDVDLTGTAAAAIAQKLEAKLEPAPGLYRINRANSFGLMPANKLPKTAQPLLLFLHGTGSNTRGSFADLWQLAEDKRSAGDISEEEKQELREQLYARYGEHVYAFEHRTLSQSPIENALALAEVLPENACLHLVSHSRGGLVGELLCRSAFVGQREPFSADDLQLFTDGQNGKKIDRSRDRKALSALNDELKKKRFKVERFVRVACPARGTTLASGRLDRWLSVVVNLFDQIPGFGANPLYEFTTSLMLAVVKKRTDPSELPGLEAMMPSAPLIRMLNFVAQQHDADLSVIAGDVEGSSLLERLKFLVSDWFYRQDHDLVVDTISMSGGAPRQPYVESAANHAAGARKFFERGARVNHFRYFRNPESVRKMYAGLLRKDGDDAGFEPLAIDYQEIAARSVLKRSRAAAEARPIVFLVPGIMGSHLEVRGNRIWMDLLDLAAGGMASLRIDAKNVNAEAIMGSSYAKLVDFLGDTHEVITFPYDWRRPLAEAADRLAAEIMARLGAAERNKQPLSVLAHSMGGLVTRTMIARHPDVWSRMGAHAESRLIMLGTPNGGSYSIPVMLTARDPLVRKLALLDLGHKHGELLAIIARFTGALQMLPVQTRWDFFDPAFWAKLADDDHPAKDGAKPWALPAPKDLEEARAARKLLDDTPYDPRRMLYVAGCAEATPFDLDFSADAPIGKRLKFQATARGDGRVPWDTGIPPGVRTWYMEATHGDLANHEEAFPALLELLQRGATTRLATSPPAMRGALVRFDLPEAPEPAVLPDEEDLVASALGASRRVRKAEAKARISVAVLHGNLAYTSNVVAVGHYEGDTIVSAERYLDRQLDGKLSACQQLGLYPGRPDTAEIFLDPERKPAGAIVVGLGQVGRLAPGDLSKSVKRGVLMYASSVAERAAPEAAPESITLASLLIGTGAGGIAIGDSLLAILRGLAQAADALQGTQYKDRVRIERIEFIELYEDRAIQAARALTNATRDAEFQARFVLVPELEHLPSGRRRVAYDDDPNWWRRLQILGDADGLQFNTLTDRARVEVQLQATQQALVDEFLVQAITETRTDNELGSTLFELLLPNRLKEQAPNQEHVVLLVNDASARYPWELLVDQRGGADRPLCVQAGMIRQLLTDEFREVVNTTARDSALIIGDPALGAAEKLFPSLDGAKREAEFVAELLGKQGLPSVTTCVRQRAPSIVRALFAAEYKILHLAGHGVYEFDFDAALGKREPPDPCKTPRKITGMVIGDGVYLTPAEVKQMRSVPELVFINCCHLGRNDTVAPEARRDRHKLAANLAMEFIRMGVKAVVAAGWEVDDAAAAAFAAKFYDEMCRGTPFGEAVLAARSAIFRAYPSVNTWGAYQCYGDHAYRLRVHDTAAASKPDPEPHYVASAEAVQELDNFAADAKTASPAGRKWLLARVKAIHSHIESRHERWLAQPALLAALGRAYAELDVFAQAIACYRLALKAERATYPFATLEQLANLQVRYAAWLYRASMDTPRKPAQGKMPEQSEDPAALIKASIDLCETLLKFGETSERLSILASAYKRKAFIDPAQRSRALRDMVGIYRKADALARSRAGASQPYPLLNALAGEAILELVNGKTLGDISATLQAVREGTRAADFWGWLRDAECALIEGLALGDLAAQSAVVIEGYTDAIKRAASPREARSVRENLELLIAALDDAPKHARNKRIGAQLRRILEAIRPE